MVDKKIGRIFSESAFSVAGAPYVTQGRNPLDSISLEIHRQSRTASRLLAELVPMLMRTIEPNAQEFTGFMKQYVSHQFTEATLPQVALITEIRLG